ncbi:MAG: type III secretion HpaP family protein [Desulfovibrionaceae bacterium]|nr:type III secretion HpaP family protein [Desulfovibrionaceae bacterium]
MSMFSLNKTTIDTSARTTSSGKSTEKPVQQQDVNSFLQAMGTPNNAEEAQAYREKGAHQGQEQEQGGQAEAEGTSITAGMSNPFEALFANKMQQVASSALQAEHSPHELNTLASKLVDRILVSEPNAAQQEVRISVSNDIMPNTEICLRRDSSGQLSIVITSENASSFQTLVAEQHTLRQLLEKQEGAAVRVSIQQGTEGEDADARKHSRGQYLAPEEDSL